MTDPTSLVALAFSGVFALGVASAAALRGWNGWLELKRLEMTNRPAGGGPTRAPVEVSDLKARVRRLEAIASGTEG